MAIEFVVDVWVAAVVVSVPVEVVVDVWVVSVLVEVVDVSVPDEVVA